MEKTGASLGRCSIEDFAASIVHLRDIVPNEKSVEIKKKIAKETNFREPLPQADIVRRFSRYDLNFSRGRTPTRAISVENGEKLPRGSTNRQSINSKRNFRSSYIMKTT